MTLADAFEQIEAALQAPTDERAHHARQALQALPADHPAREPLADGLAGEIGLAAALRTAYGELPPGRDRDDVRRRTSESAPAQPDEYTPVNSDEPPVGVEWLDEDRAVVGLELTRPIVEWIELEMDEESYGVPSWIRHFLYVHLRRDLQDNHSFDAEVEVDVPEDYARRVSLWAHDRRLQGEDVDAARVEDFAFNHMDWNPSWLLEGEPWLLAEEGPDGGESADGGD